MHDLTEVHQLTLSLAKVFIKLCEKHGLRYYFIGGSVIGILRHGGFIPWDDDIDIGMPRKDYDRLLEILQTDMPEGYGICNRHTDKDWHFNLSQFVDLESELLIHLAEKPRKAHVWLDIFPLDGLPTGKLSRYLHVQNILLHRYLVQIAHIATQVDAHRKRPPLENLILGFCKVIPVGKLIKTDRVLDRMEKLLRKYDYDDSIYVGNMLGRQRAHEVVLREQFGTPVQKQFEDILVNIPEKYHELQTHFYGDYMAMPPEEKRESHNVTILKARTLPQK